MADAPTAGRLLALLSLLQGRREWPGTLLAKRLEVSPRTVRRDVDRLRSLGYPIDSTSGPQGGYSLTAGTAMPPLLLDDEEAVAVAIALRTAARSAVAGIEETALRALVKLEQVLPSELRGRVQALGGATALVGGGGGGPTVDAAVLTAIGMACRDEEMVRFGYRARDGATGERVVEPHALLAHGRRWYLLAFDPSRTGWRTFRVDRIESPRPAGRRFTARSIPGGDAAAYLTKALAGVVYRHEARVRYHVPAAELRVRGSGWGGLREDGADACIYETSDDDIRWLAFRIAFPGVAFELLEGPPELRERLREMGERLLAGASAPGTQAGAGSSRSTTAKAGRARS